ncbi:MAG: hypothetical protein QOD53_1118 [Thermoleophilaceae bacterium]|jgi:hypothetical protein|nr:hypothetical protein [Thermoleophilaceae bacterium]
MAIAAFALLAVVLVPAGVGGKPPLRACDSRPGRTVLETNRVRLYRVKHRIDGVRYQRLWGCARVSRRTFALDDPNPNLEPERAVRVAVAGHFAACSLESLDATQTQGYARVEVTDLRTGRRHSAEAVGTSSSGGTDEHVISLVVALAGSDAWIGVNRGDTVSNRVVYEVWRQTGKSAVRLDAGSDIDPRSLGLSADGRTVYWTKGETTLSAPLPPG